MLAEAPQKPKMTFPEAEAAWVKEHYGRAQVILEYGSGGSTVYAGEQLGATVFSVESDQAWAEEMAAWFQANPPLADVRLHPVHIGPTGKWGKPQGDQGWRKFHRYPSTVWDREDFQHPDLVLIDGRFRAACWLTCFIRATQPMTVLFDDYTERALYHRVERFAAPVETRGRMAKFELTPQAFPAEELTLILETYTRVL